jgi:hypothetical protein
MRNRSFRPGTAKIPESVQLASPDIRDRVHIRCLMGTKYKWPMHFRAAMHSILKPLGDPSIDLSSGLGSPDMALSRCQESVYVKRTYV